MIDAIILAKGTSSRLYKKNIKEICGHPLVAWSIKQCINSQYIDNTYVTTESEEVKKICLSYGAQVIDRPIFPSNTSPGPPIYHAIQEIEKDHKLDAIIVVFPTTPIRFPHEFDEAIKTYKNLRCLYITPIVIPRELYVLKLYGKNKAKTILGSKRYNYGLPAGGFSIHYKSVWVKEHKEGLKKYDGVIPDEIESELLPQLHKPSSYAVKEYYYYEMNPYCFMDIDDQESFEINEALMEKCLLKGRGIEIYDEYRERWESE